MLFVKPVIAKSTAYKLLLSLRNAWCLNRQKGFAVSVCSLRYSRFPVVGRDSSSHFILNRSVLRNSVLTTDRGVNEIVIGSDPIIDIAVAVALYFLLR